MTLPPEPSDQPPPQPQWWWEAATDGARAASAQLQDAVGLALRGRHPRIVEVVRLNREHGLVAVTADTLIIAVDAETETRTSEARGDQITGVLQKSPHVLTVRFEQTDVELRVPSDELEVAIIALRAAMPAAPPDRTRHAVAPPSRPLAAPRRVSEPAAQPDRRAPLEARRSATAIGMGSRRALPAAAPQHVPMAVSPELEVAPAAPPASAPAPPAWEYVQCADGVWRRPPPATAAAATPEGGDDRLP